MPIHPITPRSVRVLKHPFPKTLGELWLYRSIWGLRGNIEFLSATEKPKGRKLFHHLRFVLYEQHQLRQFCMTRTR